MPPADTGAQNLASPPRPDELDCIIRAINDFWLGLARSGTIAMTHPTSPVLPGPIPRRSTAANSRCPS